MQPIPLDTLGYRGRDLQRPECVLCTARGDLFASCFGGGVTHLNAAGEQRDLLGDGAPRVATNGFALTPAGDFLCASLLPPGGVWRVGRDGTQQPVLTEIDGEALNSVNFVHLDAAGRTWVTVSTRAEPRALGYRADVASGYIILIDGRGARIVADGLGFTNEAKVSPDGRWLVVNETFARRSSRFALGADGTLGRRQTITEYGEGVWPDGLDFDAEGGIWVTSVISNRIIRLDRDGRQQVLIEDSDAAQLARAEQAYQVGELGREHLDSPGDTTLKSVSSIAFGGADLRTLYLGNLLDQRIYTFPSPVAGVAPPHWNY